MCTKELKAITVVLMINILQCATFEQNLDYVEDYRHWQNLGKAELENAKEIFENLNSNIAKNVILFIGDGMSLTTLTASRIYKAQYHGRKDGKPVKGEESHLVFEKFPHVALSKTYCLDRQTPDSASTASAIYSGVKTNFKTIGYDNSIIYKNVSSQLTANKVETIFDWALKDKKDVGFVTTSRVSHATPAALYAHVASRDYECDKNLPDNSPKEAEDITFQLVYNDPGRKAKVVMGGGIKSWISKEEFEENWRHPDYDDYDHTENQGFSCERLDGENLIEKFLKKNETVPGFENLKGKMVKSRQELLSLNISDTDYLLGLFSDTHMQFEDIRLEKQDQPSLSEMTEVAIQMLQKNTENGFFLMVEQSNIDHAHHRNRATASLLETMALDEAVETALNLVSTDDTLVIVTSDHSHTMSMGGYQSRGSDIRGLVDKEMASDGKPYTILSYANGPSFSQHISIDNSSELSRLNLTGKNEVYESFAFQNPSSAPKPSETHGGDDVGIFAKGPFSHLFHSVHEQTYIAHVMAYSSCIGPHQNAKHCRLLNNANKPSFGYLFSVLFVYFVSLKVLIQ